MRRMPDGDKDGRAMDRSIPAEQIKRKLEKNIQKNIQENIQENMSCCRLCPRACGVDRSDGQTGACGQTAVIKAARADLHMWEEPCLSGTKGSGAVFFSGCSLHCVFCQNHNIAAGNAGKEISVGRLAEIFLELQEKGANNINLVTGSHFVPQIIAALEQARGSGLHLPVLYNSSGYEDIETLRMLEGYVDIYLPDLKYVDRKLSQRYSHAPDYFEKAAAVIGEMVRQIGEMRFAPEGADLAESVGVAEYQKRCEAGESLIMTRGVIVRHLLLPDALQDSKRVIRYLLEQYGERIFISIMSQYTPLPHVSDFPELMRKVRSDEYEELVNYALECGIENGFIQEEEAAAESFIPEFDEKGI